MALWQTSYLYGTNWRGKERRNEVPFRWYVFAVPSDNKLQTIILAGVVKILPDEQRTGIFSSSSCTELKERERERADG